MGSSTKKHKKERERDSSRKRKHRSRTRSRSPLHEPRESRETERRHKKHHRDRKREKVPKYQDPESDDSDVIEVPTAPQISRADAPTPSPPPVRVRSPDESQKSQSNSESLSIEETNKLRAKLGLKPLDVPDKNKAQSNDGKFKDDLGEFYHAPAKNITHQKRDQKVRDRIAEHREKRAVQQKLAEVRGLAESDTDDDAVSWIKKSRELQKQKDEAAKREKILEELDAEFGIGELVAEDTVDERRKAYNARQLKGLRVEHDVDQLKEGKDIILTLKDQEVLDEGPDALVNVNMIDDERYKKSNENKKLKPHYHGYDVFNEAIEPENRTLLKKYDEVIDGDSKSTFTIGEELDRKRTIAEIKAKLNSKRLESLELPALQIASDYLTPEEVAFKKPKKKIRKLRQKVKMLKADDLVPLDNGSISNETEWLKELGVRRRRKRENQDIIETDDLPEVDPDLKDIKFEPEQDIEIEAALKKARRIKNKVIRPVEELVPIKLDPEEEAQVEGSIVLNSTAEFCRSLGEIPTYGLAGNRDEESDLMDFEVSAPSPPLPDDGVESAWNSVPEHINLQPSVGVGAPILEDEPSIGSGVGGALKLAMSKGYLEREDQNRPSNSRFAHLQAQNYSIEDKSYGGEDDKFGGRRERYAGPTTDFKEKDGFKPNVKLDYIDDDGHVLSAKEAFRYLSHKFHGKGPGKNKVEKRLKKNEQEGLMKKMSSTDTPLGTLGMLQAKQKETNSAFVVLSGTKQSQATSISKNKR